MMKAEEVAEYNFNHSTQAQVRYNDIDLAGHVNNACFHEYFDLGRTYYFHEVLGDFSQEKHVAIVQSNTTFLQELFFNDELQVVSKVVRLGTKSFDLLQAILRENDEGFTLCTFTVTTFVCMNYATGETHEIPTDWRIKLQEFEELAK